jgi:hypothetical protein
VNPGVANVLNLPSVQVTAPVLAGMFVYAWNWNRRIDQVIRRLDRGSAIPFGAASPAMNVRRRIPSRCEYEGR